MTLKNNRAPLLCCFQLCAWFHCHMWIQTGVRVRKRLSWVLTSVTLTDRRTDGRTDWTSHIAAWSQLKIKFFIHENASQNIVYEMAAILSRGRWVNELRPWCKPTRHGGQHPLLKLPITLGTSYVVKSLKLIWRSGTLRAPLQMLIPKWVAEPGLHNSLTVHQVSVSSKGHQDDIPYCESHMHYSITRHYCVNSKKITFVSRYLSD